MNLIRLGGRPVTFGLVLAEGDQLFPDETREQGRKYLEENNIEHEIKLFSDVPHGRFY